MGNSGADVFGMSLDEMGAITTQESVSSLLAVIDKATKTSHGGKFWNYTGEQLVY
jgi:norsolorinic acid ketoreductase